MLALFGVSFLTPLDTLFVLAAAVPLGALLVTERRADRIRSVLRVVGPGRRALVPVAVALVALVALVAVAAAQPVVVRQQLVSERADAQAFVLFDTSRSMLASARQGAPPRIVRAKHLAMRLQRALADVPMGVASMTDRALPNLLPTTDGALFDRTIMQSVAIDRPPPSQQYPNGRATTFDALVPMVESHFYSQGVQRRLLVVFTDGEASRLSPVVRLTLQRRVTPVFVHVWAPGEHIWVHHRVDPRYFADPTSTHDLQQVAALTGGKTFSENDFGAVERAARDAVGRAGTRTHVDAYARIALAPWFVLAGVLPLGYLLWRRNA